MNKTIVLDSCPNIDIKLPPQPRVNVNPALDVKNAGQPILGLKQSHVSCFIPLNDGSKQIKDLLELPESDTVPGKPVEGYKELLNDESSKVDSKKIVIDANFTKEARDYLHAPKLSRDDAYPPDDCQLDEGGELHGGGSCSVRTSSESNIVEKNTADAATPLAATVGPGGAPAAAAVKQKRRYVRGGVSKRNHQKKKKKEGDKKKKAATKKKAKLSDFRIVPRRNKK